jgi:hypothetical protein
MHPLAAIEMVECQITSMPAFGCGFNRSMQHLVSNFREEDVVNEVSNCSLRVR